MFSRAQAADGEVRVHRIRQDDVDYLDLRILREPLVSVVAVDRVRADAVSLRDLPRLVRVPAHECDRLRKPRLAKGRHHFFERELSETDDRPADLAWRGFGEGQLRRLLVRRCQRDGFAGGSDRLISGRGDESPARPSGSGAGERGGFDESAAIGIHW